ncbi:hypothetical protein [Deinococcus pimensis]|uniref:hypothetical protein n=1 Tax=Deinococcus pimensis TaxID=309888 RepID=UPI0004800836|nr:hypothetical protein [Deinococcus pimensis]
MPDDPRALTIRKVINVTPADETTLAELQRLLDDTLADSRDAEAHHPASEAEVIRASLDVLHTLLVKREQRPLLRAVVLRMLLRVVLTRRQQSKTLLIEKQRDARNRNARKTDERFRRSRRDSDG